MNALLPYLKILYKGVSMPFTLRACYAKEPIKLFLYLMRHLGYTQQEAQRIISKGRVFVDGKPLRSSAAVVEGAFEVVEFVPVSRGLEPIEELEEFVLYDKPSGMLVHPQNRHTEYTLLDELRYRYGRGANIVHRIDQETSGLLLCAKNPASERALKMLFEQRKVQKGYLAVVHGRVEHSTTIDAPLKVTKYDATHLRNYVIVHPHGKPSQTSIKPLAYFSDLDMTLIEARPHTGRQHQIRVHMFYVKHPIVGDPIYGQDEETMVRYFDRALSRSERIAKSGARRLLLHANSLSFEYNDRAYAFSSKVDFLKEFRAFTQ